MRLYWIPSVILTMSLVWILTVRLFWIPTVLLAVSSFWIPTVSLFWIPSVILPMSSFKRTRCCFVVWTLTRVVQRICDCAPAIRSLADATQCLGPVHAHTKKTPMATGLRSKPIVLCKSKVTTRLEARLGSKEAHDKDRT